MLTLDLKQFLSAVIYLFCLCLVKFISVDINLVQRFIFIYFYCDNYSFSSVNMNIAFELCYHSFTNILYSTM